MGDSWQIEHLPEAERDLKRFLKPFKGKSKEKYVLFYLSILDGLKELGLHPNSAQEPLPGSVEIPAEVGLWKIRVNVPGLTGAVSRLRVLYLRMVAEKRIVVIAVYTHKDFKKRPPDRLLAKLINGTLGKN